MSKENPGMPGGESNSLFQEWRKKVLNYILLIAIIVAFPALITTVVSDLSSGDIRAAVGYTAIYGCLVGLIFLRRLDTRLRTWVFLLLGYAAAIWGLGINGLPGSGRVYLMALPVLAFVFVGRRSGWAATVLSLLILGLSSVFFQSGLFGIPQTPALDFSSWSTRAAAIATFAMLLLVTMVLLAQYSRLQEKIQESTQRVSENLGKSEERYRNLFDGVPVGVYRTTPDGRFLDVNLAMVQMLGYPDRAALLAANAADRYMDSEVREQWREQIEREGLVSGFEFRVRRPDGSILWVENTARTVREESGRIVCYEGALRDISKRKEMEDELHKYQHQLEDLVADRTQDLKHINEKLQREITDRQRAEQAAQESERRLADIINFLPDATLVVDGQSRVIAWNHAIEKMTGVPARDMLGKGDHEYALPFYGTRRPILIDLVDIPVEEFMEKYAHVQRDGPILAGETYVPSLKKGPAYLFATASALRDSQGNIVGAIETIRDITDRKRAEEELQKAKGTAEAATQAKSAFLASMSHEIRTPMNAIIGMTSLLLDTTLSGEQREYTETIRDSGDALLAIINDILDFSKIEAGRMELENQPFDLYECVESASDLLAPEAARKGLDISCAIDEEVPVAIIGDVTRLRQILVNLIGNAVKFTEHGEVAVSIRAEKSEGQDALRLDFAVRDTGIGIPPDRVDRLFQSFSQVDTSTARRHGGTGLGLAISKRLSELMGGTMRVESEGVPGKGSTFHFTIPVTAAPQPASRPYLQETPPSLSGKKVLVVDDNETNRQILRHQMEKWGMAIRDTGSPGTALEWIRRGDAFDLGVLDVRMPEMDGITLAAEMRKIRRLEEMPLVMVTSLGRRETGVEDLGVTAFLSKPIKPSQLYNTVVKIFQAEERAEAGKAPASVFDPAMGQRLPLRILLAEDNAINQKLVVVILKKLGYRADLAANGLEVLSALQRQMYDVILMDVQMPEMDGLTATREICKAWPAGKRPRIIALTASALKEDCDSCLEAGMDDFLGKPIRVEELVTALEKCKPLEAEKHGDEQPERRTIRKPAGGAGAKGGLRASTRSGGARKVEKHRRR
jgi:PAS domain S-box-containing protein